jgi:hypothetical protein
MAEIMRTNDIIVLERARTLLEEAEIPAMVLDGYMSGIEGAIGAFPRRLMVPDSAEEAARALLEAESLGEWLVR